MTDKFSKRLIFLESVAVFLLLLIVGLASLIVWETVSPSSFLDFSAIFTKLYELIKIMDESTVNIDYVALLALRLSSLLRSNLNFEQRKLHATLIGNLANIILGAGAISLTIKYNNKIPDKLDNDILYNLIGNVLVIVGTPVVWLILHFYAVRFIAENGSR